jgi:hypothetical protein
LGSSSKAERCHWPRFAAGLQVGRVLQARMSNLYSHPARVSAVRRARRQRKWMRLAEASDAQSPRSRIARSACSRFVFEARGTSIEAKVRLAGSLGLYGSWLNAETRRSCVVSGRSNKTPPHQIGGRPAGNACSGEVATGGLGRPSIKTMQRAHEAKLFDWIEPGF